MKHSPCRLLKLGPCRLLKLFCPTSLLQKNRSQPALRFRPVSLWRTCTQLSFWTNKCLKCCSGYSEQIIKIADIDARQYCSSLETKKLQTSYFCFQWTVLSQEDAVGPSWTVQVRCGKSNGLYSAGDKLRVPWCYFVPHTYWIALHFSAITKVFLSLAE